MCIDFAEVKYTVKYTVQTALACPTLLSIHPICLFQWSDCNIALEH